MIKYEKTFLMNGYFDTKQLSTLQNEEEVEILVGIEDGEDRFVYLYNYIFIRVLKQ